MDFTVLLLIITQFFLVFMLVKFGVVFLQSKLGTEPSMYMYSKILDLSEESAEAFNQYEHMPTEENVQALRNKSHITITKAKTATFE